MQDVEAVPAALLHHVPCLLDRGVEGREEGVAVRAPEDPGADDQHRLLGGLELVEHGARAFAQGLDEGWGVAEVLAGEREVDGGADGGDGAAVEERLAEAGVEDRGLVAGVGADEQDEVGLLNRGDPRVLRQGREEGEQTGNWGLGAVARVEERRRYGSGFRGPERKPVFPPRGSLEQGQQQPRSGNQKQGILGFNPKP